MACEKKHQGSDDSEGKIIRNQANSLYKEGKYEDAIKLFESSLKLDLSTDLVFSISINMAVSASNCNNHSLARENSIKSIQIDPTSVRGYFWKGMSEIYLELFSEAEETFQNALKIDTGNSDVKKRITFLNFCNSHKNDLKNLQKKDWLKIEDAVRYNINFSSNKNFAHEITKMIKRRKDGSIVCISGGICNFYGKIIDLEIPVHVLTKKQKENALKLNTGEYAKFFIQILMTATSPPYFELTIKCKLEDNQFNDAQKFCFRLLEEFANNNKITQHFNPYLPSMLFSDAATNYSSQNNAASNTCCKSSTLADL